MTAATNLSEAASSRRAEGGFLLVAVLWMLAALATLASIYSVYAAHSAMASHTPDERLQAEASVRAGVELAAWRVLTPPEAARPTHGAFAARVGRTRVEVNYRSEGARIDLNAAPKELFVGLFGAIGVADAAAQTYAERILGWRRRVAANADNPEAAAYQSAGLPYRPRQAPFNDTMELRLVLGLPPAVVDRIMPLVTVFSGRAQVDVLNAEPTILAALPGMTPQALHNVLQARANDPSNARALLALLGPARTRATSDGSKALRATILVSLDNGRRVQAEVVFKLRDGGDEPYDILLWRDDFDGPAQAG